VGLHFLILTIDFRNPSVAILIPLKRLHRLKLSPIILRLSIDEKVKPTSQALSFSSKSRKPIVHPTSWQNPSRLSADDKSFLHAMPFLCDGHVFLLLLMICKPSIKHGRPRRYPPLVVTGCRYSRVRHVIRTAVLGYYSGSSHMMCTIDVMAQ